MNLFKDFEQINFKSFLMTNINKIEEIQTYIILMI